jgi:general secretion pathway protein G
MVLVILGLLASIVVYNLAGVGDRAKVDATQINIKAIEGAIDLFRAQVGRYPESLQELMEAPENEEDAKRWAGPYLKESSKLQDAWHEPFVYECPGQVNKNSFDLSSGGPDKDPGNDDDITNWEKT